MTKESTIRLMESKLRSYRNGYLRAAAAKDEIAAAKWKSGYNSIREEIEKLKQS